MCSGRCLRVVLVQGAGIGGIERVADALGHLLYVHLRIIVQRKGASRCRMDLFSLGGAAFSKAVRRRRCSISPTAQYEPITCSTSPTRSIWRRPSALGGDTRAPAALPLRAPAAPPYLHFPIPPLVAGLPDVDFDALRGSARLKFYDYGVISFA